MFNAVLAFKPADNLIVAYQVKSYLDSTGVKLADLQGRHEIPENRYRLFTCENCRRIVFARLKGGLKEGLAKKKLEYDSV